MYRIIVSFITFSVYTMKKPYIIILITTSVFFWFLYFIYNTSNVRSEYRSLLYEYNNIVDKYDIEKIERVRSINEEIMLLRYEKELLLEEIETKPDDILNPEAYYEVQSGSLMQK